MTGRIVASDSADAGQVEPPGVGVAVLGQQDRAGDQQQHHHRHAEQEHRAPPEVLQQHAADQRADAPCRP